MKYRRESSDRHHDDIIDLTNISATEENRFICKKCLPLRGEQLLVAHPENQRINPFAGPSYKCPVCNTVYDSSLVKLPRISRKVRSTIGSEQDSMSDFIIATVPEDKGLLIQDEYDRINSNLEPDEQEEEEMIKTMGGSIIHSEITVNDSLGNNRTVVKRRGNTERPNTL